MVDLEDLPEEAIAKLEGEFRELRAKQQQDEQELARHEERGSRNEPQGQAG